MLPRYKASSGIPRRISEPAMEDRQSPSRAYGYRPGQDRARLYRPPSDQEFVHYDDNMVLTTPQNRSERPLHEGRVQTWSGNAQPEEQHAVHIGEGPSGQGPQHHQGNNRQDPPQAVILLWDQSHISKHIGNPNVNRAFVYNDGSTMIPMTTFDHQEYPTDDIIPTVSGFLEPPVQDIKRTDEDPEPTQNPSLRFTIFTRSVSVLFIVLNLTADWIQYEAWADDTSTDASEAATMFSWFVSQKETASFSVECDDKTSAAVTAMAVINALGSLMALLQAVDIVGETLLDADVRGFQIMHGWNESLLSLLLEEIPQAIVVLLLNNSCRFDAHLSVLALVNMFVGSIKTAVRFSTCKQEIRCRGGCKSCCDFSECCMYSFALPCLCRTLIIQPCGDKGCIRFEDWEICKNLPCHSEGDSTCLGGYKKDPVCSKRLFEKLSYWHSELIGAVLLFYILRATGVVSLDFI